MTGHPLQLPVKQVSPGTMRELMAGYSAAEIVCVRMGDTYRIIKVIGNTVTVDPLGGHVVLPVSIDAPLNYIPWDLDRGSIGILHPDFVPHAEICIEYDLVRYSSTDIRQISWPQTSRGVVAAA